MKKWKKTTAFVLAALMLLCGCSQNGGGGAAGDGRQAAGQGGGQTGSLPEGGTGRYLEHESELSGQLSSPAGLVRRSDGSLAALDYDSGLYLSYDGGLSWEKGEWGSLPELAQENYIMASAHSPEGNTVAAYIAPENMREDGKWNPIYILIDPEGNQRELPIQCDSETGYLNRFWYLGEGMLYGQGFDGNVYQISETDGSMKKVLDMWLVHMTAVGDRLLLTHQEGFTIYDPATGEQTEDTVLNEFMEKNFNGVDLLGNTGVYSLLAAGGEDGQTVYLACQDGIYSHVLGGSLMEQVVDGSMTSLSDPRYGMVGMAALDSG